MVDLRHPSGPLFSTQLRDRNQAITRTIVSRPELEDARRTSPARVCLDHGGLRGYGRHFLGSLRWRTRYPKRPRTEDGLVEGTGHTQLDSKNPVPFAWDAIPWIKSNLRIAWWDTSARALGRVSDTGVVVGYTATQPARPSKYPHLVCVDSGRRA
jgi:hypothetical protein